MELIVLGRLLDQVDTAHDTCDELYEIEALRDALECAVDELIEQGFEIPRSKEN